MQETTIKVYRRSIDKLLSFIERAGFQPDGAEEWDDILVEYSYQVGVTISGFRDVVAAFEFVLPQLKGRLPYTRDRCNVLSTLHETKHTVPAGEEACILVGTTLASLNRPRMGLGMMLQQALGLRPGELLHLTPEDVAASGNESLRNTIVFRLGKDTGTKIKREQCALLRLPRYAELWSLVSIVVELTPSQSPLFPFALPTYAAWLKRAQSFLRTDLALTPHSPRAGFATDALVEGRVPSDIREAGRWQSESSFRIYLDVVGALGVGQQLKLAGFERVIPWLRNNLGLYFNASTLDCYGLYGKSTSANKYHRGPGKHSNQTAGRGRAGRRSTVGARLDSGAATKAAASATSQSLTRGRGRGRSGRFGRR